MGEVVQDGIILVVSEFIILILYIVLSGPVAQVLNTLTAAGTELGVTQMSFYDLLVKNVFTICFILLGFVPVIWFVVRMMSREPDWGYRYY